MRSKLGFLIGVSFGRKVKTKWFVIAQLVLLTVIVCLVNIDTIINAFGGDFNKPTQVYVIDDTDNSYDLFKESFLLNEKGLYGEDSKRFEISRVDSLEDTKDKVDEEGGIIVHIAPSDSNVIDVNLISKTTVDTYVFMLVQSSANGVKMVLTMDLLGLTTEDYQLIMSDVKIEKSLINNDSRTDEENMEMLMSTVFPIIILPIFMLSILIVQMIGAEVNDEKTTKAMEIIISNVSPKTHFFAKVIASNLFVLLQGGLLLAFSGIAFLIRMVIAPSGGSSQAVMDTVTSSLDVIMNSSIGDQLVFIIPIALLLIVLTFIAYSLLAGILASMTTTIEDYQQLQMPIIIVSLVGYYLSMMAGYFDGSVLIKVLSFLPFISAILSPSLLVLGQIGIIEVLIAIVIMIVTNYLLIKYGLKIYKVGILNYSSSGLWKKMLKALKE